MCLHLLLLKLLNFCSGNKYVFVYNLLCYLVTFCVITWWIYKFSLQNLSSSIDVKNFFESDVSVQPALSVCVIDPKLDEKVKSVSNSEHNKSTYIRFLRGKEYYENLAHLDFSQIRFNWSNYFYIPPFASLVADNGSYLGRAPVSEYWKYSTSFIGLQSNNRYLTDCISLEPLKKETESIRLWLNSSIFYNGVRPRKHKFRVFLHYPGQIIRSFSTLKSIWNYADKSSAYHMRFRVMSAQVLHRYPTRHQTCIGDWRNYDKIAFQKHLKKLDCQSPYQYIYGVNYSICSTKEKIRKTLIYPSNRVMKKFDRPCRSLESVHYKYSETKMNTLPYGVLQISFYFSHQYKEIVQYLQTDIWVSIIISLSTYS